MAPEDMEKTTFFILWGTFCYKVMSFGLKNVGATYQWAMVGLFHDMMHKEIEVYVDDMVIKGSALVDYLAQQPINDYQPIHPKFPDEDIMTLFEEEVQDEDRDKWIVWFDGVSNAPGNGVGAVLVSPDEQYIPFMAMLGFDCTNNIAEYELKGEWETRDHKLVPYQAYIRKLIEFFDDMSFHHIPREENQMADALATLASMFQLSPHKDLPYIEF
ncbi:uncharacterized protein [Glycine max]|uniref:uncharacterized protein n=1 Tax=Glycine max TaxID=3847 RepID=UPI0003DEC904|nr:uncharacterized protein LOC102663946 [Glycine max]|eukprot:XP_006577521.1 uncharacterized protein LOC102663946 [Glycine max]